MLAITNPKKKDQSKMGLCSNSHFMLLTKDNTLIAIPITNESKKLPFNFFHPTFRPSLKKVLTRAILILLRDVINSSYIPEINAIVPPETPGTTSAAPMAIPFKDIIT